MSRFALEKAAGLLHTGGIVAYPTEAVFGLGCDPLNEEAVYRLLKLKQRPIHKGLILIASDFNQLTPYVQPVSAEIMAKVQQTWPGPHTWVMPATDEVPYWITGDHDSVAVRVTAHPLAAALCERFGGAIVSTSANHSGRAPTKTAIQTRSVFGEQIDMVLQGRTSKLRKATPIRDALSGEILRN